MIQIKTAIGWLAGRKRYSVLPAVLLTVITGFCLLISSCAPLSGEKKEENHRQALQEIEEKWGIQILGVRQSAAGYMLDFRFKVLDPDKAAPLLHPKVKPYLIDQASGTKLAVPSPPKVGALRQRSGRAASGSWTSFILFSNPGKLVKPSGQVTVVIGSLQIENLVVE